MKIGIIGGGSVGLLCACYLSLHHQVTVLTRRAEQAEAICSDGIHLYKEGREYSGECEADTEINSSYDLLLVTVKQHQLGAVFPKLDQIKETNILFLQNGMAHIHEIQNWRTAHSLYVGIVEHGAVRKSDTAVEHTGLGAVKWSAFGHSSPESLHPFFQQETPGFPIVYETDWHRLLTGKLIINACINPLTALLRVKNGELLASPAYFSYMKLIFREACAILGLKDREKAWEQVCAVCENTKDNYSSMLVDVYAGRLTEADAIIGYLLKEAEIGNHDAIHFEFLYRSITALRQKPDKVF
ncbi:2-dehydropantoate 2-reductase [Bacillus atrophaeus]|uniref:2-dehydropantoate 2-reductase n=1 Tax=Bacillus atrophaeus TaxID=1452 RepID=UPI003872BD39